jgi:hypothetical protein
MKKYLSVIMLLITIITVSSCSRSTRYIKIQEPDVVYEYGKGKYEVWPGDLLEIRAIKTCRGGSGICWKVRNVKTGEIGYVNAVRMKERHHVYTEQKKERTVLQDNVFYSSTSPKIKIKIHSDFKYIGKVEKLKWSESVEKTATTHFEGESYLFGHIEDDKILKGVVIRIFTLGETHWHWSADLFSWVKDNLDSGDMKIEGKRYQRIVSVSRLFSKDEADFISDKGYIIPSCFLVKGLGRIVSADGRTKMYIFYIEDIRHIHGIKYSCRDWINKNMLTNEQEEFLKEFIDRSEKNIQILGKKEVTVSQEGKESPKLAAKETAPPATTIDKVVIGVLDFERGGVLSKGGGRGFKKTVMMELRRNPQVKLVDIHDSCSLSDLKRHGYLRGEWFKKKYQLDMILHVLELKYRTHQIYFSLIDLSEDTGQSGSRPGIESQERGLGGIKRWMFPGRLKRASRRSKTF